MNITKQKRKLKQLDEELASQIALEFQEIVLEVIGECAPEVRDEIVRRLVARRDMPFRPQSAREASSCR